MSKPRITKTVVQKINDDGEVVSETITTVEERDVEKEAAAEQVYGMYL